MSRTSVQRYRSNDVVSEMASFEDLLLPAQLVQCLAAAGFTRPSPVQAAAIPVGRIGRDMIVQAKSGTGKTLVFSVLCLDKLQVDSGLPQALIVAPTRELALQSCDVIHSITQHMAEPRPAAAAFVGGLPAAEDAKRLRRTCHIVVGTPGRLCALAGSGSLPCGGLKQLVLDEADQLMADSFRPDVVWLHQQLPSRKQVLAFSATYTPDLMASLGPLLRNPHKVLLCEETVSLEAIKQYYCLVGPPASEGVAAAQEGAVQAAAEDAPQGSPEQAASAATSGHTAESCQVPVTAPYDGTAEVAECTTAPERAGTSAGGSAPALPLPDCCHQQQVGPSQQQQDQPQEQEQQQEGQQQQQEVQEEEEASPGLNPQEALLLKVDALLHLLSSTPFHQAVVFCNRKPAADWLRQRLTAAGFPAAALSADCPQTERMATMAGFRAFKVRILVSTDVMARGVDLDRVNLVANLDLPPDAATYVHRVGRTGRFGTRGLAVAFVTAPELQQLRGYLASVAGGTITPLPDQLPDSCHDYQLEAEWEQQALQQLQAAPTCAPPSSPPPMSRKQLRAAQRRQQQGEDESAEEEECGWEEEEEAAQLHGAMGGSSSAEAADEGDPGGEEVAWWEEDRPLWLDAWEQQATQLPQPPTFRGTPWGGVIGAHQQQVGAAPSVHHPPEAWGMPAAADWWGGVAGAPQLWSNSTVYAPYPVHQHQPQQQQQYWDAAPEQGASRGSVSEAERRAAWAAYYASIGWDPALLDAPTASTPQVHQQQQQQQPLGYGASTSIRYPGSTGGAGVGTSSSSSSSSSAAAAAAAATGETGSSHARAEDPAVRWSAWRDYYMAMGWDVGLLGERPAPGHWQPAAAAGCGYGPAGGGAASSGEPDLALQLGLQEEEGAGDEWDEEEVEEEVEEELDSHAAQLLEGLCISIPADLEGATAAAGPDHASGVTQQRGSKQTAVEQGCPVRAPASSSSTAWPGTPAPTAEAPTTSRAAQAPTPGDHCSLRTGQGCAYAQAWATWHQAYSTWVQAYEGWRQQCMRGGA